MPARQINHRTMNKPPVKITLELPDETAWQLAQFLKRVSFTTVLRHTDTVIHALDILKSSPMTSPDDLNDIARAAVDSMHGARAPAKLNDDERDEWRETADRLFLAACQAISGDMNEATAKDFALAAVRKAAK